MENKIPEYIVIMFYIGPVPGDKPPFTAMDFAKEVQSFLDLGYKLRGDLISFAAPPKHTCMIQNLVR